MVFTITQPHAVALAHAIVADAVATLGIRFLVIKGIGSQLQGLQRERIPSDVDVLVAPADFDALKKSLMARGWQQRPEDADTLAFPRHSTSFFHRLWPCDIDLHYRYPGLEGDATRVFEELWTQRDHFVQAGHRIPRPDVESSILILALHHLRSIWIDRHRAEYAELIGLARQRDSATLLARAADLGALACARPFIVAAFGDVIADWGSPSTEWQLRTRLPSAGARRLAIFLRASAGQKVRLLGIALFPRRETLQKTDIYRQLTGTRLAAAYLRRWCRGIASLSRSMGELRRASADHAD